MERAERFEVSLTEDGRYRLLVDAITDYAIYMLDPQGYVTSWNAGAQRFKGYTAAEILGHHFSRFYTAEDRRAGLPEQALAIAAGEGRVEQTGWRLRKDGTRFWAHMVLDAIREPSGRLVGFAKVTRDLTERKLAEHALRRSEEQFKRLVQGVSDYAIYMLDATGRVTNWNLGAERIKGYRPEEIIGEHFSRFYTPEDRQAGLPERALAAAAREGRFEKEGWRVRKDGTRFWANVVIDAIRGDDGELIGFAKITRDVTERMEAQHALERAREALFQAQKMESIGQLTGGIAHDFNNLLMAVLGSLELVRKRLPYDPKITPFLDNAVQGAERGATLTQRMLAFARRQELKPTPVDIPGLVYGMNGLLQRSLGPSLSIETRFPLPLEPVMADANQIETALLNLVVNARDAMPDGGTIVIAASPESVGADHPSKLQPGRYVVLSVTDTGEGMDEETLARATEPFFTTKGPGKGTGLGLSMVHGLAEQLGGRLMLTSRKDHGTTVALWLPVVPADSEAARPGEAPPPAPAASPPPLVVLAVDDDGLVLMNTVAMLEELGHRALEATSAKEALELIDREPQVDLVITDQAMPQITGSQLAEMIHAERPELPVVLATGYAELPSGAGGELPKLAKPFGTRELELAIAAATVARPAADRSLALSSADR